VSGYAGWVAARRALWDEVEARIGAGLRAGAGMTFADLEELALQYRRLLQDVAVARDRFPGTAAALRLERLALRGAFLLQGEAVPGRFSLRRFYAATFPRACRRVAARLGAAAALFAVAALFTGTAALVDPGLGARLLGPERMAALERGEVWTERLTTAVPPSLAASGIATNNMSVALVAWAGGTLAGLGPLYILTLNGALLGGVFAVTWRFGLAGELGRFVLAHGPLEIFLILVSAAAGLHLAAGLIVATDRPRAVTLREHARESVVAVVGSLPWFLLLGVVEALVSPMPVVPVGLKAAVAGGLLAAYAAVAFRAPAPREERWP